MSRKNRDHSTPRPGAQHDAPEPAPRHHVVLIGYRASGKTSTGRILACTLGAPLIDLDERLAAGFGFSIAEAFGQFGEPWFRAAECVALERAFDEAPSVISVGGGTPCSPGAAKLLGQVRAEGRAMVVYLRATPSTLRARLMSADNAHRPSLTGAAHPADEVEEVLGRRKALYEAVADAAVDVDDLTPDQTAAAITKLVRPRPDEQ